MIWVIGFLLIIFSVKFNLFISLNFHLDKEALPICLLLPGTYFLVPNFLNGTLRRLESLSAILNFSLISFFLIFTFLSCDPFRFLIGFEGCAFPMLYVFLLLSKDIDKVESLLFIVTINLLGSIPFMIFLGCYLSRENFYFRCKPDSFFDLNLFLRILILMLIKFPLFLFHSWLTKAHVRASGPCSIVLASLILKLGTFGLFKYVCFFRRPAKYFASYCSALCLWGTLLFLLLMVRIMDMKLIVASSSVVHMSSMVSPLFIRSYLASVPSLIVIIGHGFVSFSLFFLVTLIYEGRQSRCLRVNKNSESLNKSFIIIFFIYIFLNLGLPPFITFLSELWFLMFYIVFSTLTMIIFSLIMVASILYTIFFVYNIIFAKKRLKSCIFLRNGRLILLYFPILTLFLIPMVFSLLSLFKIFLCDRKELAGFEF